MSFIIKNYGRRGFTLIEMLLVVVIIGVLASAVVVNLSGRSAQAKETRAKADLSGSLPLALDLFDHDIGRYPSNSEGLEALITDPGIDEWNGPYIQGGKMKLDPWNRPYVYNLDPDDPKRYVLKSNGPDESSPEDDVTQ